MCFMSLRSLPPIFEPPATIGNLRVHPSPPTTLLMTSYSGRFPRPPATIGSPRVHPLPTRPLHDVIFRKISEILGYYWKSASTPLSTAVGHWKMSRSIPILCGSTKKLVKNMKEYFEKQLFFAKFPIKWYPKQQPKTNFLNEPKNKDHVSCLSSRTSIRPWALCRGEAQNFYKSSGLFRGKSRNLSKSQII